jgi:hypothetical protein
MIEEPGTAYSGVPDASSEARARHMPGAAYEPPGPGVLGDELGPPLETQREPVSHRLISRAFRIARRPVTSPYLQGLVALAVYVAMILPTRLGPSLLHPSVQGLRLADKDPNFFVWMLRWWPYALAHHLNPMYTTLIRAPGGFGLTWISSVPALSVLAAPLTETVGPVSAFNLLNALALPLTAWAAFVFCRRLTGQFWPSLVGGAIFGFSVYELTRAPSGDLDLTYLVLLPVLGYLVVLWWQGAIGRVVFVVLAGLALAVQFYLFVELFADLTALLVPAVVLGYAFAGRGYRRKVARLAALLGLAYVLALALAVPYLYAALTHLPSIHVHGVPADLGTLGTDLPLYVAAIGLVLLHWSSRLARLLGVMLVLTIAASLGSVLTIGGHVYGKLPWGGIWNMPFLKDAFPNRLLAFAYLILAVMTALFLAEAGRNMRDHWWRWLLAPIIVAVMVANMTVIRQLTPPNPPFMETPAFITSGQYRQVLTPGETVAVISGVNDAGMLWQADTNFYFRIVGGYVGIPWPPFGDLPVQIQNLANNSVATTPHLVAVFKKYVVSARIGAILVQEDYKPFWVGFLHDIGLRGQVMGGVLVYTTDGCRACMGPQQRRHLEELRAHRRAELRAHRRAELRAHQRRARKKT